MMCIFIHLKALLNSRCFLISSSVYYSKFNEVSALVFENFHFDRQYHVTTYYLTFITNMKVFI